MSHQPNAPRLNVVYILIGLNLLVFLLWQGAFRGMVPPEVVLDNFLVSRELLDAGRYWVLITAAFSHNMLFHLLINMFVLWSFGLLLLFAMIFPRHKILLFGVIPVPALVAALAFIAIDLWGLFAQYEGGGLPIGHGAHLGGAATGIVYYFLIRSRRR